MTAVYDDLAWSAMAFCIGSTCDVAREARGMLMMRTDQCYALKRVDEVSKEDRKRCESSKLDGLADA